MDFSDGRVRWRQSRGKTLRIAVCGDTCPAFHGEAEILAGKSPEILAELLPVLEDADLRIAQWEVVLTRGGTPILKDGPNLKADPGCTAFLKAGRFDAALLANNHTGDFGEEGVLSTLAALRRAGIPSAGAGQNAAAAGKILRLVRNGFRVSIVNFCEQEFGCAYGDHAGSNAMDELAIEREIAAEKRRTDILLVVSHGGNEHNPVPSPRLMQRSRAFAEAGASAVVNIHQHCPQGIEVHGNVPIVYSPGNFFFPHDPADFDPANFWWSGYLPVLTFDRRGACALEVTPYAQEKEPWRLRVLTGAQRQWYLDYLTRISAEMLENGGRWFDRWCAYNFAMPLEWFDHMKTARLLADPEDAEALRLLPGPRHMFTCQSHCELVRRLMLLIERREIAALRRELPLLQELRTARFAELPPASNANQCLRMCSMISSR